MISQSRYQDDEKGLMSNRYLRIHYNGSVREYMMMFESLCIKTISLHGRYLEYMFLFGLKPRVQAVVTSSRLETCNGCRTMVRRT